MPYPARVREQQPPERLDAVSLPAVPRRAPGREHPGIKTALYQVKGLQGATGTITINEKGSAPKEERIWQIKEGKEVLLG